MLHLRLILNTTDNYQQVTSLTTVYDNDTVHRTSDEDYVYFMHNVTLPVEGTPPGRTYYIQCKYQNALSSRPVLHTYPI